MRIWLVAIFAIACTRTTDTVPAAKPPSRAAPAAVRPPQEDARVPIVASWREERLDRKQAVVVARVERLSVGGLELKARVELPPGLSTTEATEFVIPPAVAPSVFERRFVLDLPSGPPDGDLVLVVQAAASDFGFHARVPYRFGRAEPTGPQPKADGPRVRIGGHDLGSATPVTK